MSIEGAGIPLLIYLQAACDPLCQVWIGNVQLSETNGIIKASPNLGYSTRRGEGIVCYEQARLKWYKGLADVRNLFLSAQGVLKRETIKFCRFLELNKSNFPGFQFF